jgi:hypothetical protein
VLIAVEKGIAVFNLNKAGDRPYSDVVTTGLDFGIFGELAFVNDTLVQQPAKMSDSRNPDLFLA